MAIPLKHFIDFNHKAIGKYKEEVFERKEIEIPFELLTVTPFTAN